MRKLYRVGADLVLVAHFAFAAAAVFGGVGTFLSRRWALAHVPIVAWSGAINLIGWTCPLTPLEKRLRRAGGDVAYEGSFIQHYIGPLVYPRGMRDPERRFGDMPRSLELTAGVSVLAGNALLYAGIWLWRRAR